MSQTPKVSFWRKKKRTIITLVGVVLLLGAAAGAGVFWRWQQTQTQNKSSGGSSSDQASNGENDGLNQNPLPDSVKTAQDLASSGNTDQANKEIATSLANTSSNDEKYELYVQQGINYENEKKYDEALASYRSAEAIKKTSTVYAAIGRAYEGKGDKNAAITNYKAAIPLLDTKSALYDFDKTELENKIKALGG